MDVYGLIYLEYDCNILVKIMVTILEQNQFTWKQRKLFRAEILLF